jgi:ATP-dependent Clp protease adapter protein ClpS
MTNETQQIIKAKKLDTKYRMNQHVMGAKLKHFQPKAIHRVAMLNDFDTFSEFVDAVRTVDDLMREQ